MKRITTIAVIAAFLAACGDRAGQQAEQGESASSKKEGSVDYDAIASRVVSESAQVKPGDVVVINGTPTEPKLLEALQTAVLTAGGHPIVTVSFPRAEKRFLTQAPPQFLRQPSKSQLAMIDAADVFINADAVEDPTLFSDVDEARLNMVREANQTVEQAAVRKRARSVDIGQSGGIPTAAYAKSRNADYEDMRAMFFRALAVPTAAIAQRGRAVSAKMQPGSVVRVRSEEGTDLTFRLATKPSRVSTGRASDNDPGTGQAAAFLPAGDFYACVEPNSATGVLVSNNQSFRGQKIRNLRITFQGGLATSISADEGAEPLNSFFSQLDEPSKRLSLINIGLNPESRPLEGSDYLSWEMAGVPTVFIGNSQWAGCDHGGEGSYAAHLTRASVAAGNAQVVDKGSLVLN